MLTDLYNRNIKGLKGIILLILLELKELMGLKFILLCRGPMPHLNGDIGTFQ